MLKTTFLDIYTCVYCEVVIGSYVMLLGVSRLPKHRNQSKSLVISAFVFAIQAGAVEGSTTGAVHVLKQKKNLAVAHDYTLSKA